MIAALRTSRYVRYDVSGSGVASSGPRIAPAFNGLVHATRSINARRRASPSAARRTSRNTWRPGGASIPARPLGAGGTRVAPRVAGRLAPPSRSRARMTPSRSSANAFECGPNSSSTTRATPVGSSGGSGPIEISRIRSSGRARKSRMWLPAGMGRLPSSRAAGRRRGPRPVGRRSQTSVPRPVARRIVRRAASKRPVWTRAPSSR